MYYLIRENSVGSLIVREYTKRELREEINRGVNNCYPYVFAKEIKELTGYSNKALLINGDIVVPREKRVVVEYEVE